MYVRNEHEFMPKNYVVVRFHILPYPIHSIRHNKKIFSGGVTKDTHAGKKRWGVVFYGVKFKLLAY